MSIATIPNPDPEVEHWEHDLAQATWRVAGVTIQPICLAVSTTGRPCKARAVRSGDLCVIHSGRIVHSHLPSVPATPLLAAVTARGAKIPRDRPAVARALYRAKRSGRLTLAAADSLANELLGEHPATLWGDAWWDAQN